MRLLRIASVSVLALAAACGSGADETTPDVAPVSPAEGTTSALPSELSSPSVYVAKVKNVLVGLPPTADEVKAVEEDPARLGALVDGWMKQPEYAAKMLRFFQLAFQQTQVSADDFAEQTFPRKMVINRAIASLLVENLTESFARTVLALVEEGRPFTEAMTTRRLMMTPALMQQYAFLDSWQVDNSGKVTDRFSAAMGEKPVIVTARSIPIAESIDPASPNYMKWTFADLPRLAAENPGSPCYADPVVFDDADRGLGLQFILQGSLDGHRVGGTQCQNVAGAIPNVIGAPGAEDDFTRWRMVTIRAPKAGEKATAFYDMPKLRDPKVTELVLTIPRVGFFSTPAFFANWQTNTSNQMRVTMNQALIVGLGAQVDGSDATKPLSTPGLDATHAAQPACISCHQTLDPTRSIFASSFSWSYHVQREDKFRTEPGMFAFQGVEKKVSSLADFGDALATHPLFAKAWAQKLCFYVNSRACDANDPELVRIVDAFVKSNHSWSTLVRELVSSPLTTNARATKSVTDQGEVVAIARRDHLCAAIDARLGFDDVCGLKEATKAKGKAMVTVQQIVAGLPSDGYGRGSVAPVLPNAPTLFFRAGTENVCTAVAEMVIDPKTPASTKRWASGDADRAIADFVAVVMGLPPTDKRAAPALAALRAHFAAAQKEEGISPSDALKSTFVVACLAPSSVAIGL